ncbi:DUF1376 domain-containing protein [Glaciimonas sp. PCH181]|uniref:DUF1376 domain-containing protein n=1 Tax=Glaciimonas sp. PCH181 TaxID=2133943 RepID=UPI00137501B2|nr:DUF1376 domain-containing protein [Glaciimonas sp. PCH181]
MNELPAPLSPADCDLRDFPFLPVDISRLFNSEFHARSNDTEWRAGVTLWLKSFHQVPAGSIPDDDIQLARLAELGRDTKTWKKIKASALHGWIKCADGRLYHPVVAEKAAEALAGKKTQRGRTAKARLQAMLKRLSQPSDILDFASVETSVQTVLNELSQYLSQSEFETINKSVTDSVTEAKRKREGERKGQGEGKEKHSDPKGSGGPPPSPGHENLEPKGKSPEEKTKQEIWRAAKSLLAQGGMPEAQCGSFVGKLVSDYSTEIVLDAVRTAVVEQPADPASFLKAVCQTRSGERKTVSPWWSSTELILAKAAEMNIQTRPGELMPALKARIEAAIANDGKPPAPPAVAPNSASEEVVEQRSPEAVGAGLAAMREASSKLKRVA